MTDLYGGIDLRDIPTYSIGDAAHYLRIPKVTIRSWIVGRSYQTLRESRKFKPLISTRDRKPPKEDRNVWEPCVFKPRRKNERSIY